MCIGRLSDTYRGEDQPQLWDELVRVFDGVDFVLHAGDLNGVGCSAGSNASSPFMR
jgi:hypothetical protein